MAYIDEFWLKGNFKDALGYRNYREDEFRFPTREKLEKSFRLLKTYTVEYRESVSLVVSISDGRSIVVWHDMPGNSYECTIRYYRKWNSYEDRVVSTTNAKKLIYGIIEDGANISELIRRYGGHEV